MSVLTAAFTGSADERSLLAHQLVDSTENLTLTSPFALIVEWACAQELNDHLDGHWTSRHHHKHWRKFCHERLNPQA